MGLLDALLYRNRDWRDWTTGGIAGPIGQGPNYQSMNPPQDMPPFDPTQGDYYPGGAPFGIPGSAQPQQQGILQRLLGGGGLGNLAQLGMLIGGGKYGGYGVQGYQQAEQQDIQNEMKRRQIEAEAGLNRSRLGLEERRISGEEEERKTRTEELKSQREQGNVSAALTQFESGLAGIDASDPVALTNYAESIAETRGLTPDQTARFMKVAERRAALKPQTPTSPIAAKVAEFRQMFGRDPDQDTLKHFFGIASTERPMEVINPAKPGNPTYANYRNGKFYDVDTDQEIKGARPYERPSVALMNRDEMMPVIDRVARSLAGVDAKGNQIAPDLTSLRQIASLRGDQRILLYDKVKQYNPKFNTAEIDRMIKMEDNVTNGRDGQQIQSFGTFLEHAGAAKDALDSINLSKTPAVNRPLNWWRQNMSGDPNYQRLITSLEPVRKEFEGFLLGGRALYAEDRKSAEILLNDNSSPAQIEAALNTLGHTAAARFNEMNFRYKRVMKRDIADPFAPEAIEGARKIGVELVGPKAPQQQTGGPKTADEYLKSLGR